MLEMPIDAAVHCTDGPVGKSTHLIINPTTRKVTHIVVREEESFASRHWLVPIEAIADTRHDLIDLKWSRAEVSEMEEFSDVHFIPNPGIETGYPADAVYLAPYVSPLDSEFVALETERIPPGELAVHRGALVEATDGYVGTLGELLLDPESQMVTHLILQEGHLWGKKEVMLPLAAVDQFLENSVLLKVDKAAITKLPAIPVRRDYGHQSEASGLELFAKTFSGPEEAGEALAFLKERVRERKHDFRIRDAAIIVKDEDGKTHLKETADLHTGQGRLLGAVFGGLVGLIGGPIGVIVGALAGAGTGAFVAKHMDMGISDKFLGNLQDELTPGTSALVILVERHRSDELSAALAEMGDMELRHTLSDKIVEQILAQENQDTISD